VRRHKCPCGATIVFGRMASGKSMPLDEKPVRVAVWVVGTTDEVEMVSAYVPHWGTCPRAKEFKKPKEPRDGA